MSPAKKQEKRNKNMELLLSGSVYKGLFILSLPIVIGNVLQGSYQFIDAYWISKISTDAIAASSSSGSVYFLLISIGIGFSMAGTILISQFAGAKNQKMVNKYASQTVLVDIFMSLLLGTIGYFNAGTILELIGVKPDIIALAVPFLQVTFMGMVFSFIFSMFQSILRWVGEVKLPMYIIGVTVLLNVFLDPMFIFGFGFIPAMGLVGAAWATMLVQAIAALTGIVILVRGHHGVQISLRDMKPDWSFIKKIFFLGLPSSVEMSLRSFGMVMMLTLVTVFGTTALAGYGAAGYIFQMVFFPVLGFSIATSTMIGQNIGANRKDRLDEIAKKSMIVSFSVLTGIGVLIYIFSGFLISLFVKPEAVEATQYAVDLLHITAWSFGFMGIQFILTGIFRAAGLSALAMNLGIISMFVIQFPLGYILSHTSLGIEWVWMTYPITNIIMVTICTMIFLRWKWKEKNLIEEEAYGWVLK